MKKIALALVLVGFSYGATAATACNLSAATAITAGTNFIKQPVTPRCSANTYVQYTEDTTRINVGSGSQKGKKYFGGSSEGGAVTARGDCAASGCTSANADSGATAAASS